MPRKTVHLVPAEDAGWIVPLFAPIIVRWSRSGSPTSASTATPRTGRCSPALRRRRGRPLDRTELAERLEREGFEAAAEFKVHLWLLATLDGELCLGPDRGGQTCLVRTHDWLGELEARSREDSLAELARRYIRAWAGVRARLARCAVAARLPGRARADRLRAARAARRRRGPPGDPRCSPALALAGRPPAGRVRQLQPRLRESRLRRLGGGRQADPPGVGIVRPTVTVDGSSAPGPRGERAAARGDDRAVHAARRGDRAAVAAEVDDIGRFEGLDATLT